MPRNKTNLLILFYLIFASAKTYAYVPDSYQSCRIRNETICEINNVRFQQTEKCPPEAKIIKDLGNEDCDKSSEIASHTVQTTISNKLVKVVVTQSTLTHNITNTFIALSLLAISFQLINKLYRKNWKKAATSTVLSITNIFLSLWFGKYIFLIIFNRFNNHDTIAPVLISSAIALVASM